MESAGYFAFGSRGKDQGMAIGGGGEADEEETAGAGKVAVGSGSGQWAVVGCRWAVVGGSCRSAVGNHFCSLPKSTIFAVLFPNDY